MRKTLRTLVLLTIGVALLLPVATAWGRPARTADGNPTATITFTDPTLLRARVDLSSGSQCLDGFQFVVDRTRLGTGLEITGVSGPGTVSYPSNGFPSPAFVLKGLNLQANTTDHFFVTFNQPYTVGGGDQNADWSPCVPTGGTGGFNLPITGPAAYTDPCAKQKEDFARLQAELQAEQSYRWKRLVLTAASIRSRLSDYRQLSTEFLDEELHRLSRSSEQLDKKTEMLSEQLKAAQSALEKCRSANPDLRVLAARSHRNDCTPAGVAFAAAKGRAAGLADIVRWFGRIDFVGAARKADEAAGRLRSSADAKVRRLAPIAAALARDLRKLGADVAAVKIASKKAKAAVATAKAALSSCQAGG